MKRSTEQIERLVETYLKVDCIHKIPYKNIKKEIISTYDGEYPSYIIEYDAKDECEVDELYEELIKGMNKYTNLKDGKDYWLSLRWSWNS